MLGIVWEVPAGSRAVLTLLAALRAQAVVTGITGWITGLLGLEGTSGDI